MNKITCLTRLRNESLVLPDFLDHIDSFCDEAYFFDDCSTDNSVEILEAYPKTKMILRNYFWENSQAFVQTAQRKVLLDWARIHAKNDWMLLIEPDERICFDFNKLEEYDRQGIQGIYLRLVDAYLTPDCKDDYKQSDKLEELRKWFGKEYREIMFLFKKDSDYNIEIPACRQPITIGKTIVDDLGYVLHYGKSLSISQWEENCNYYSASMPMLKEKWEKRKGKSIHDGKSDFNTDIISKDEIIKKLRMNGKGLIKI